VGRQMDTSRQASAVGRQTDRPTGTRSPRRCQVTVQIDHLPVEHAASPGPNRRRAVIIRRNSRVNARQGSWRGGACRYRLSDSLTRHLVRWSDLRLRYVSYTNSEQMACTCCITVEGDCQLYLFQKPIFSSLTPLVGWQKWHPVYYPATATAVAAATTTTTFGFMYFSGDNSRLGRVPIVLQKKYFGDCCSVWIVKK